MSQATSPYSSGGGGVTFERRVGAVTLARMLTVTTHSGLGGRLVNSAAFPQAPKSPTDDLVVTASRAGDETPESFVRVGARRAPKFTKGNPYKSRRSARRHRSILPNSLRRLPFVPVGSHCRDNSHAGRLNADSGPCAHSAALSVC